MSAFEAAVLGIVQGLTEFLPISSSAHLRIVPAVAGWSDPGAAFTAVTQLGTMAAVLLYFRDDLWRIVSASVRSVRDPSVRQSFDARLGRFIALGTVPIAVLGFTFRAQIEDGGRDLYLIGVALIVFGLVLLAAEWIGRRERAVEELGRKDAVAVGFAQALALIPGVSRSGATISMGLLLGFDRAAIARYSFLLSVPAVVLSGLFELRDIGGASSAGIGPTLLAAVLAFVVGYASIAFLLRFLVRHTTVVFVVYRVVLGIAVLALAATQQIA